MEDKTKYSIIYAILTAISIFLSEILKLFKLNNSLIVIILIIYCLIVIYVGVRIVIPDLFHGRSHNDEIKRVYEYFLQSLHGNYLDERKRLNNSPDEVLPDVRTNIMILTKLGGLGHKKENFLKLYYYFVLSSEKSEVYTNKEMEIRWHKGEGNCGRTWNEQEPRVYKKNDPNFNESESSLTPEQKLCTDRISYVLSVPMVYNKNVIGVLNFDSIYKEPDPKFEDPKIRKFIEENASQLARIIRNPVYDDHHVKPKHNPRKKKNDKQKFQEQRPF